MQKIELVAKHIVFSGNVQGVGFRFTALNIANHCHLTGHVRNLPNGAVEMLAQGPAEIVDNCVRDIQDSFAGYIRQIDVEPATPDPKLTDFKITF
jgi:acylphosphatase